MSSLRLPDLPDLKLGEISINSIPSSPEEAVLRDVVSILPLVGNLYNLLEFLAAMRDKRYLAALIYLVQMLPGPELPLTHLLVYALESGR